MKGNESSCVRTSPHTTQHCCVLYSPHNILLEHKKNSADWRQITEGGVPGPPSVSESLSRLVKQWVRHCVTQSAISPLLLRPLILDTRLFENGESDYLLMVQKALTSYDVIYIPCSTRAMNRLLSEILAVKLSWNKKTEVHIEWSSHVVLSYHQSFFKCVIYFFFFAFHTETAKSLITRWQVDYLNPSFVLT